MSTRMDTCWYLTPTVGAHDYTFGSANSSAASAVGANTYAYGNNTGDARFVLWKPSHTGNLSQVLFYVGATTTNGGIISEIRESNYVAGDDKPGPILLASNSQLFTAVSNTWAAANFAIPAPIKRNHLYYFIIGNGGGNISVLMSMVGPNFTSTGGSGTPFGAGSTNTSFNSTPVNPTIGGGLNPFVFVYEDGYLGGHCPYTSLIGSGGFFTNTSTYQGLRITGLTNAWTVSGIRMAAAANITVLSIFKGNQSPLDTPDYTESFNSRIWNSSQFMKFATPYTFAPDTNYRIVIKGATVQYYQVDGVSAFQDTLRTAQFSQGKWMCTKELNSAWVDLPDSLPFIALENTYLGTPA